MQEARSWIPEGQKPSPAWPQEDHPWVVRNREAFFLSPGSHTTTLTSAPLIGPALSLSVGLLWLASPNTASGPDSALKLLGLNSANWRQYITLFKFAHSNLIIPTCLFILEHPNRRAWATQYIGWPRFRNSLLVSSAVVEEGRPQYRTKR